MGLFNFGASRTSSDSRSFSSSFDNLDSFGVDVGFDTSRSESAGGGSSFSRSGQRVAFADVFENLFGAAGGAAGRAAGGAGVVTDASNLLFNTGGEFIESLAGGGAGGAFLEDRLAGDGLAGEQIDLLGEDIRRFLAEGESRDITASGVSAGTLGGSRGEVQRGIAERGAVEAFQRGAVDIRQAEQTSRDAIAGGLLSSESDRAGTALSGLTDLFGLAEAGNLAELSPLMALSQIIGPQLALTESAGGSEQFSQALSEALGVSLGLDQTTGRAGSTSSSTSRSRGSSFSFGTGT